MSPPPQIPGLSVPPVIFIADIFHICRSSALSSCRCSSRARIIAGGCRICRQFPAIVLAISLHLLVFFFLFRRVRPIDVRSRSFHLGAGLVSLVGQKQTSK